MTDEFYMEMCLELARQAQGRTAPNPIVGCIVLSADGKIVGRGHHERAGEPHAEVHALNEAGDAARGGTLYVNLEPCCHHGKTPPCSDRVIKSGVKRVVAGMQDPNPKVGGGGLKALNDAGIEVKVGILEEECRFANRGFIKRIEKGLPWVCLKLATTLDGKIADRFNTSKWITGPDARHYVHELRNIYDCVLVGANTARQDDPELNVREIDQGRHPIRAVVDPTLSIDPQSRLCKADSGGRTIIFYSECEKSAAPEKFPSTVSLVPLSSKTISLGEKKHSHLIELKGALEFLASEKVLMVLCEGGGKLASYLLREGLVDEVQWLVAPKILGDHLAISAVDGDLPVKLTEIQKLKNVTTQKLGDDILIHGLL